MEEKNEIKNEREALKEIFSNSKEAVSNSKAIMANSKKVMPDSKEAMSDSMTNSKETSAEKIAENEKNENLKPLGKFKNPEELFKAYNALEAEFTRRSQKLSEYERQSAQKQSSDSEGVADNSSEPATEAGAQAITIQNAEKENEDNIEIFKMAADKFFSLNPAAQSFKKEIAKEFMDDEGLSRDENGLEKAFSRFLVRSYTPPSELTKSENFLERYVFSDEQIKNRIIEDYLKGLSNRAAPATLKGAGVTLITPPSNPKTIEEAGWMFVRDNG